MTSNIRLTLKHCGGVPSASEARRLILAYRAGDESAREDLITGNLPMVVRMVQVFRVPPMLHDEAFQEGVLGLMRAVDEYDPEHESRACFCTVAHYWVMHMVQQFMRKAVRRFQRETPIGIDITIEVEVEHDFTTDVDTAPLLARLSKRERKALEQVTMNATLKDVAAELGVCKERVRQIRNMALEKLRGMVR